MKLEEEDIISMIMIEMGIIEMIEILGMTRIGFKNHKGMSSLNPTKMSGRR